MKKIFVVLIIVAMLIVLVSNSYAAFNFDTIFTRGNSAFNSAGENSNLAGLQTILDSFGADLIKPIGYLVFAVVTVVLGAKYIWSGVEGKSKIKETLPAYVTAVVFFYLATNVVDFAQKAFGTDNITSLENTTKSIWANICSIMQVVAFGGIVAAGIKYMFESAEGKAKLKERMFPLIIGMIFVFCASGVVEYIITAADTVI